VVLIDIRLPDMTGYDVVRSLRQELQGSDALLLAVTGFGEPEVQDRCREAGFDGRLVKPVDPAHLIRTIAEHLRAGIAD
jgi:CheY-like chemotaxis protein